MNKRPGHVNVTVETGYCNFCGRTRNLRREEHQLGTLVRTIITCESCHRTLSSSVGVAAVEPEAAATVEAPVAAEPQPAAKPSAKAKATATDAPKPKVETKPKTAAAERPARPATPAAKTTTPTRRTPTKKK
jgi:hypothetical protein